MRLRSALLCSWMFVVFGSFARASDLPNVIVILADDLGLGDYSAFGTRDIRTPNLDRLAREGMTFENFRANSCVCSPTRAALLTGCYPDRVGVPGVIREETPANSWGYLDPRAKLLPQILKTAGYHSALIGKWHLGISSPNTPVERGFDFFHGFLGDMMDDYWTHLRNGQNFMRRNDQTIHPEGHATDLFTRWACEYLEERSASKQPFFLYLAYNAPHDPLQPRPDWFRRVVEREPGMSEKRAKLVALIEHMDEGIGELLSAVDRLGLLKETLVVFSSDNGGVLGNGACNGPFRSQKGHMYEGGLRVPAFVRWPGRVAPGSKTSWNGATMDIFPTVCEAARLSVSESIDGRSFLPAILGQRTDLLSRESYYVRREGGPQYGGKTIESLIRGDWKLIQDSPFSPLELYNLKEDPSEAVDLSKKEPRVFRELSEGMRRQIQRGGGVSWQRPS